MGYKLDYMNLWDKFNDFNWKYFDGYLRRPEFEINKSKSYCGQYNYNWTGYRNGDSCRIHKIKISVFLDRSEQEFETTLLHEMIHEFQKMKYGSCDHGKTFKAECERIKRLSGGKYDISRCSDISDNSVAVEKKSWTELLVYQVDGHWAYSKPSKGNASYLIYRFKNNKRIQGLTAVQAYGDFRAMHASVERLNYEKIDNLDEFWEKYNIKEKKVA